MSFRDISVDDIWIHLKATYIATYITNLVSSSLYLMIASIIAF